MPFVFEDDSSLNDFKVPQPGDPEPRKRKQKVRPNVIFSFLLKHKPNELTPREIMEKKGTPKYFIPPPEIEEAIVRTLEMFLGSTDTITAHVVDQANNLVKIRVSSSCVVMSGANNGVKLWLYGDGGRDQTRKEFVRVSVEVEFNGVWMVAVGFNKVDGSILSLIHLAPSHERPVPFLGTLPTQAQSHAIATSPPAQQAFPLYSNNQIIQTQHAHIICFMLENIAVDIEIQARGPYNIHAGLVPGNLIKIETQGRPIFTYNIQYAPGACKVKQPHLGEFDQTLYQPYPAGGFY
jgi:hypothetical protein